MTNKHKKHENWGVNLGLWDCPKLVHLIPSVNSEIAAPAFQIVERSPIVKGGPDTIKKKEVWIGSRYERLEQVLTFFHQFNAEETIFCTQTHSVSVYYCCTECLFDLWIGLGDFFGLVNLLYVKQNHKVSTIIYKYPFSFKRNTTHFPGTN